MDNKTLRITLVDGQFKPGDAKDILHALLTQKIQYHTLRNLSHEERFGKPDKYALERLKELNKDKTAMADFLGNMDKSHHVDIKADIIIVQKQSTK